LPLVFVHGVNVRRDSRYDMAERTRDHLFRHFALRDIVADPHAATIENPYWGQHAATFRWQHASLPAGPYEQFGTTEQPMLNLLAEVDAASEPEVLLASLAQRSMSEAIDCLWAAAALSDSGRDVAQTLAELAKTAVKYADAHTAPSWLAANTTNHEFLGHLLEQLLRDLQRVSAGIESFGVSAVWDHLHLAIDHLQQAAAGPMFRLLTRQTRPWLHHKFALFVGDLLVYLRQLRDQPDGGAIVREVRESFLRADALRTAADPHLIVVAHSMGGNISYDALTHDLPKLAVDVLVTVGSQVALLEELKLFQDSDPDTPGPRGPMVEKPRNVARWIAFMSGCA
jgi:hypothetical protein